ncbi:MAG: heme exporter protein CcmB [Microscillaceae bacterium]
MRPASEIIPLLWKEIRLEWRQRHTFNSLLLYMVSTIWVVYLSFNLQLGQLSPITWNTLYWIILLFAAINSIGKSFIQEREGQMLYYYTLHSPVGLIFAKIIYNALLLLLLAFLGLFFYTILMGLPVQDVSLFGLNVALGCVGFATTLTMVAGIAAKTQNSSTLMAVLGFPVILPMLLMLLKVSKNALDGLDWSASSDELLTLTAINLIVISFSYFLFPYLWRS